MTTQAVPKAAGKTPSKQMLALRSWSALERRLKGLRRFVLLLDYDGTLTPIVERPEQAKLSASMRKVLERAAGLSGVTLGVVSGRSLADVRAMVGLEGVVYVGNHGCEIAGNGLRFLHPKAKRTGPQLAEIASLLGNALDSIHGSQVEDKGLSLSVHWRRVAARDRVKFRRAVQRVLAPWAGSGSVRITQGKRVIEVRTPIPWDKGKAVDWIASRLRLSKVSDIWYLGDDRTDEDAFRAINEMNGASFFVGGQLRPTLARWWLHRPSEVRVLIERVIRAWKSRQS